MSFGIRVDGGSGAGIRRPLQPAYPKPWRCTNHHQNPRYATRCLAASCRECRPPV